MSPIGSPDDRVARVLAGGLRRLSTVLVLVALAASCAEAEDEAEHGPSPTAAATGSPVLTVPGVLATDERFERLFDSMSNSSWNHTVFAPTDEAFEQLPRRQLRSLLQDEDRLRDLLDNHIAFELVPMEQMQRGDLRTIQGVHEVDPGEDPVTIDGVRIVEADIITSNGIIHAINGVLAVLCRQIGTGEPECTDLLER